MPAYTALTTAVVLSSHRAMGATVCGRRQVDTFLDPSAFNELPLPRPAEQAHLAGRTDGTVPDRVKWQYHYLATFCAAGYPSAHPRTHTGRQLLHALLFVLR